MLYYNYTVKRTFLSRPEGTASSCSLLCEIPDKEDIYTKDDCNTDLAFVSYIGDLSGWDWIVWDRCNFKVKMYGYGFSDNASQAIRYAEEKNERYK